MPADAATLARCAPIYETLAGWRTETSGAKRFEDLPRTAQVYLKRLETLLGTPICLISNGSKREQAFKVGAW